MSYRHLTALERVKLSDLLTTTELSLRAIAKQMNRSQSSLSREIQRNCMNDKKYFPDTAQAKAEKRRQEAKPNIQAIEESCLEEIKKGLEEYHSPEQISGRMRLEGQKTLSHETIYKLIYTNYSGMGVYRKKLRQGRIRRRNRGSGKSLRGRIPGRVGIEERPEIANEKTEIGHWESDTMIGGNHNGVLVTHVDKASKFLMAGLAKDKTSEAVNKVTVELFSSIESEKVVTMTSDNGKEFTQHEELSRILGVSCYFANPYHSWERGLNEHTNGLIRQFFPKKTNFRIVKREEVNKVVNQINNRPRKSLGYRTPFVRVSGALAQVFYSHTSDNDALQI